MKQHDIEPHHTVYIADGEDIDVEKDLSFKGHIPNSKEYKFYYFKKSEKDKKQYRLFECNFDNNCSKVFPSLNKFFDHLRSHTDERPFICTVEGCEAAFSQQGNLKKHLEAHADIKRFSCSHCDKRFSKKYNLLMHLKSAGKHTK